jgi:hypothetical protein
MNSNNWTKEDVIRAQALREEQKTANQEFDSIKAERAKVKGSARIKFTKRIKELEARLETIRKELKELPLPPMTPDEAWKMWSHGLYNMKAEAEKTLQEAREELATKQSLAYSMQSLFEIVIKAETRLKGTARLLEALEALDIETRLVKCSEYLEEDLQRWREEVLDNARWGIGRSTDPVSNAADGYEISAKADFVDQMVRWSGWERRMALAGYEAWKLLNN